jgi:ATP-dependent 26S proteasome regulatory subunit
MKLPGFCIVLSQVRDSLMGETAAKLQKAFALTEQGGSLLFLDEFDAIATIRSSEKQAASQENSAVVSSLLQMLDNRPQGIIVAATNRIDIIDPAILRRFDASIEITAPTEEAAEQFEGALFNRHRFSPVGWEPTDSSSFSSIERDVVGFIRSRLLSNEGVKR